jgi:alkanesulfonate monooxygenase SsuD/methylene tetrahydromethanopterin reductase-like flavin-dependent oxidoreductase (luciferase family)
MLDSTVALTAAAAVTDRIRLGFGTMVLALRSVPWAAKQLATMQRLSSDRVILGVGTGGAVHGQSAWRAVGVPWSERGRFAERQRRPVPMIAALGPDITASTVDQFVAAVTNGYGIPADQAAEVPIVGSPHQAAERFAEFAEAGVHHLVLGIVAGDWLRQCELIAQAMALLD